MRKIKNLITFVLVNIWVLKPLHAELVIDVTSGRVEPMPIAVTDFYGATPHLAELGAQITKIVSDDLITTSGLAIPLITLLSLNKVEAIFPLLTNTKFFSKAISIYLYIVTTNRFKF